MLRIVYAAQFFGLVWFFTAPVVMLIQAIIGTPFLEIFHNYLLYCGFVIISVTFNGLLLDVLASAKERLWR